MRRQKDSSRILSFLAITMLVAGPAHASVTTDGRAGMKSPVARQAVLLERSSADEPARAVCVVSLSGRQDLAPDGLRTPPVDFRDARSLGLHECSAAEIEVLRTHAQSSRLRNEVAGIPVFAAACAGAFVVGTGAGALGGTVDSRPRHPDSREEPLGVSIAALGTMSGAIFISMTSMALAVPPLFACGFSGAVVGYVGALFF